MNPSRKSTIATVLFIVGMLLAGAANALARMLIKQFMDTPDSPAILPFFSTVMFCLNLAIYLFLLIFWLQSVRGRLLPSRERSYLIAAAVCAITMLVLRSAKYRMVGEFDYTIQRCLWYLYYVPMLLLPTLFLMTCIGIEAKHRERRRFDERLLLIPAAVMIVLFLTNDLHHFAFAPVAGQPMNGAAWTYTNQPLLYIYYGYYGVAIGVGLVLLTMANRRLHSFMKAALPFLFLFVMLWLTLIDRTLRVLNIPSMYLVPETVAFGMVGVFESCIRNRLIPYNENYAGFFSVMPFPVIITERDYSTVYRTAKPVQAAPDQLSAALEQPICLDEDTRLSGRAVSGGYAFYTEDLSELHRLNEKLTEANELIASENDLIQAENELRQRRALVDSRNLVYSRISEKMYPYHRRAQALLDAAKPNDPSFSDTVARLNILYAYIKRGTNLLLTAEGSDRIPVAELKRALQESVRYLHYCGVNARADAPDEGVIDRDTALRLYTAFEETLEALLGSVTMVHISLNGCELRVTADCEQPPQIQAPLPVTVMESDGLYYFVISGGKGDA